MEHQTSDLLHGTYHAVAAGIYNAHLLDFLHRLQLPIWLEGSLQIKRAGGLQRGKTARRPGDTIDAQRIAEYAFRFRDRMRLWQPPRPVIQQLAFLSAARQRLIQRGRPAVYNQLANPLTEQQNFVNPSFQKQLIKSCRASLMALEKDRKAVDKAIDLLIEEDRQLKELFGLLTSVPGIGIATATEVVIATNELKTIADPKQMARATSAAMRELRPLNISQVLVSEVGLALASTLANGLKVFFT
ncbi:hypothetical protein [Spirosoma aureum]|uniref:hypothetical protein n=1 Tax=Spirosoma aureum TaxID=2692134 RepID=UPI001E31C782|nr:hypothetical protein [Spirosoma aureum]